MLDFQPRCDRCHEVLTTVKLTSEKDPYCQHCGHVLGHCLQPSSWVCVECGEIILCHGGDERPGCDECKLPMKALSAQPSRIHGAGTGDTDLEHGLAFLMEAQEPVFNYIPTRGPRAADRVTQQRKNELKLGSDLLRDSQTT